MSRQQRYKRKTTGELPAELTQARRFGKARSAQSTALLEDYVELIADLLAARARRVLRISRAGLVFPMPLPSRQSPG